jgi:tetratricopeptide (TPR) repeat protein
MKRFFSLALIFVFAVSAFAQNTRQSFDVSQYGVRIEPDRRLIVVLAALEAAGLETPLTAKGKEFRQRLQTDFKGMNDDLRQKMTFFVTQYKKRHEKASVAELVAPFISMAYTLGPVPDLNEPVRATDLPGDLLEVLDFSPYLRQFYRSPLKVTDDTTEKTTTIGARIEEYYKEYQATGDAMRPSTARMVRELLDYLHTRPQTTYLEQIKTEVQKGKSKNATLSKTETRERERRFFIVPDLLAQEGAINFRNIGDDYYVIVPPGTDLSQSEVRRAYLQFVLDPVILKNAKDIATFREGIKSLLDERRKVNTELSPDIFLAVSRSLVAAADARQAYFQKFQEATAEARRTDAGRKPISESVDAQGRKVVKLTNELYLVDGRFTMPVAEDEMNLKLAESYERGAVLAFYFANSLKGLEDSQFDIASSLRDIILSLDTTKEANRLAETADARKRALAAREEEKKRAAAFLENSIFKKLEKVEPLIQTQRYTEAETALTDLLKTNPTESRLFYALGRVKSLSAAAITDVEKRNGLLKEAKDFYSKALEIEIEKAKNPGTVKPDAALVSLAYVALARIYEYYDQNAYAIKIYEQAISMGDVPDGAYREAVTARERLLKEQQ